MHAHTDTTLKRASVQVSVVGEVSAALPLSYRKAMSPQPSLNDVQSKQQAVLATVPPVAASIKLPPQENSQARKRVGKSMHVRTHTHVH